MPYGFSGVATGAATVFFAVFGYDAMSTAAEEAKDAERNLPKAISVAVDRDGAVPARHPGADRHGELRQDDPDQRLRLGV